MSQVLRPALWGQVAEFGQVPVALQPISCKVVVGLGRHSFRPALVQRRCSTRRWIGCGRRARARICPTIVPAALRTDRSCKATVSSGETKSAVRSPRTTLAWTSGAIIPAGRHGASRRPIAGRPGDYWAAGSATVRANRPATPTAKTSTTKATRSITATNRSQRPMNMPNRRRRSPPPRRDTPESSEWLPLGLRPHAGRPGLGRGTDSLHSARH